MMRDPPARSQDEICGAGERTRPACPSRRPAGMMIPPSPQARPVRLPDFRFHVETRSRQIWDDPPGTGSDVTSNLRRLARLKTVYDSRDSVPNERGTTAERDK